MLQEKFNQKVDEHLAAIQSDYKQLLESGVRYGHYDPKWMRHTLELKVHVFGQESMEIEVRKHLGHASIDCDCGGYHASIETPLGLVVGKGPSSSLAKADATAKSMEINHGG